jgi:hypothetical protein
MRAKDENAGRKTKCPGCGTVLTIPGGAAGQAMAVAGRMLPRQRPTHASASNFNLGDVLTPKLIGLIALLVVVPGVVLAVKYGPVKAQAEWEAASKDGTYAIEDVVGKALQVELGDLASAQFGHHVPQVKDVNWMSLGMMWRMPDSVDFGGSTSEGHMQGTYYTRTGEVDAKVKIMSSVYTVKGHRKGDELTVFLNGKQISP